MASASAFAHMPRPSAACRIVRALAVARAADRCVPQASVGPAAPARFRSCHRDARLCARARVLGRGQEQSGADETGRVQPGKLCRHARRPRHRASRRTRRADRRPRSPRPLRAHRRSTAPLLRHVSRRGAAAGARPGNRVIRAAALAADHHHARQHVALRQRARATQARFDARTRRRAGDDQGSAGQADSRSRPHRQPRRPRKQPAPLDRPRERRARLADGSGRDTRVARSRSRATATPARSPTTARPKGARATGGSRSRWFRSVLAPEFIPWQRASGFLLQPTKEK